MAKYCLFALLILMIIFHYSDQEGKLIIICIVMKSTLCGTICIVVPSPHCMICMYIAK